MKPGSVLPLEGGRGSKQGSLYLTILSPGTATPPWLLTYLVGSSLVVNTGRVRCVADAQPWGNPQLMGEEVVWKWRFNHSGWEEGLGAAALTVWAQKQKNRKEENVAVMITRLFQDSSQSQGDS